MNAAPQSGGLQTGPPHLCLRLEPHSFPTVAASITLPPMLSPKPTFRWFPDHHTTMTPWSPASGWLELEGTVRKLVCVIPCRNQRRYLSLLLPQISDLLTESGCEWEVLLVDAASDDGSISLLRHWSQEAGFRVAACSVAIHRSEAILTGLAASRGDAFIVLDPHARYRMTLLRQALAHWRDGARIVFATHEGGDRVVPVEPTTVADSDLPDEMIDPSDFGEAVGGFVLLDARVVHSLLGDT